MAHGNRVNTFITVAIVLIGFAAVYGLSDLIEARRITLPESYSDSDLSFQGKRLNHWALGSEGLLADWYWMWSLQYLGDKIVKTDQKNLNLDDLSALNPRLLYPLLDNASELDPQFMAVYSYGASVLPAIDPQQAVALTEKGIERNPNAWRLYQYLGYIYWRLERYDDAADVYERGSKIAGVPQFMKEMAATMRTKGGSRDTARAIYKQIVAEAEDEQSKRNAQSRLNELQALDEIDAVNAILSEAKASPRGCPAALADIFPKLQAVELPSGSGFRINARNGLVDPSGTPYMFDRSKCEIRTDPELSSIKIFK